MITVMVFFSVFLVLLPIFIFFCYEIKFNAVFQLNPEAKAVSKAALGTLLGGTGYFYGQSKISTPPSSNVTLLASVLSCKYLWKPKVAATQSQMNLLCQFWLTVS